MAARGIGLAQQGAKIGQVADRILQVRLQELRYVQVTRNSLVQLVPQGIVEGQSQFHGTRVARQLRRAQAKGARQRRHPLQHTGLKRRVIGWALIEQRLDEADRGLLADVVGYFGAALQQRVNLRVDSRNSGASGVRLYHLVHAADGVGVAKRHLAALQGPVAKPKHIVRMAVVVDEWTAAQHRISNRGPVQFGALDERVQHRKMRILRIQAERQRWHKEGMGKP